MSVTRINEFQAAEAKTRELREFLASVTTGIESSKGCISCRLMQDQEDQTKFIVVEVWESIEAHKFSVGEIDPDQLQDAMRLLAGPPQGRYLTNITNELRINDSMAGDHR